MEKHIVKIKSITSVTHDVLRIVTNRPEGYNFTPGQATEVSVNKEGWREEKRPFTFTCLPDDDYLEFIIKVYTEHKGVTNEIRKLKAGDKLIVNEVFGTINYRDEGVFIAGGAGVTPFISIFRHLRSQDRIGNNKLIFANKTKDDIMLRDEFEDMLGDNFINILSEEETEEYAHGFVSEDFLRKHTDSRVKNVYICGPPKMLGLLDEILSNLNIDEDSIVREEF